MLVRNSLNSQAKAIPLIKKLFCTAQLYISSDYSDLKSWWHISCCNIRCPLPGYLSLQILYCIPLTRIYDRKYHTFHHFRLAKLSFWVEPSENPTWTFARTTTELRSWSGSRYSGAQRKQVRYVNSSKDAFLHLDNHVSKIICRITGVQFSNLIISKVVFNINSTSFELWKFIIRSFN